MLPGVHIGCTSSGRYLGFHPNLGAHSIAFVDFEDIPVAIGSLTLAVSFENDEARERIVGFHVDGKKNIARVRHDKDGDLVTRVAVKRSSREGGDVLHTEYPDNNIRLLEIRSEGEIALYEAAIVSQAGKFFLVCQRTAVARVFNDGGTVVCPQFAKWGEFAALLNSVFEASKTGLPDIVLWGMFPPAPNKDMTLDPREGSVLWYNVAQGLGAVCTAEGNARVHWSNIRSPSDFVHLEAGDLVRFDCVGAPENTKGRSTQFKLEIFGVSPVHGADAIE